MDKTLPLARRPGWLHLLTAAFCFWGAEGKVYYSCGAEFNSLERGLILSPGFPNSYSSGMHCIWQFFIPARMYLMLEIFDFDVFESTSKNQNDWDNFPPPPSPSTPKNTNEEVAATEENPDFLTVFSTKGSFLQDSRIKSLDSLHDRFPETTSPKHESKQFQQTEESKELASNQSSGLSLMEADNLTLLGPNRGEQEGSEDPKDKILLVHLTAREKREDDEGQNKHLKEVSSGEDMTISSTVLPTDTSSTQQSSADVCPHDVLYVTDLITFSSRFCGTNSPLNKDMAFGSSLKMVEVIVELITTTDRGRGFAMLFEYKNDTESIVMNDSTEGRENIMMLVIITGILFFALVLLSTLCIACRQQLCPKRNSLDLRCDQENGIQNAGIDINELRLVMPSQENENNNHSVGGNGAVTSCSGSTECSPPQTDPDVPSSMSAVTTESGSDEDKSLKRSITSPGSVSDWRVTDQTDRGAGPAEKRLAQTESHCPRQRTWSARAFQDLLAPLPQLQKKWRSWTTNSPFTKLVNSGGFSTSTRNPTAATRKITSAAEIEGMSELAYSDSSASTASYPLTHSAQKQRKLSSCNLKRSRFGNPYFGFLTSSPDCNRPRTSDSSKPLNVRSPGSSQSQGLKEPLEGQHRSNGSKSKELSLEMDKPKAVFVISEEGDDQQPLVLAEHVHPYADALPEPNVVMHNLGIAMMDEQPMGTPVQGEGFAESPSTRTEFDLWGEYPSTYRDSSKGCKVYKEQNNYTPVTEPNDTHQTFDSLASHTLCQTSVQ
ncbi:uncharacterized protein LOC132579290 isoform X2 [Heteronotia binoei]|uniref:uncharacterized protein LOC132579290 isoform X2 n=1 Tax=Heteronotia binoei TaxID=13085 RepID=UPI00292EF1E1|nr:uncharacterized protein LOC132579290 isoform X2 [Heteronotia binoei]